jgi:orotate phosphoribosyltransferase
MGKEPFTGGVDAPRAILKLAHEKGAVLFGEFTLASGKKSDHYWDGRKVSLDARGACLVGAAILEMISSLEVEAVGGLEMGAIPIATSVALMSNLRDRDIPAFVVRKEAKRHGTRSEIEGCDPSGKKVIIVDDVITSGGSILKAIEAVEARGCKVVKVIALVDRHEGGSDSVREKGYSFQSILDFRKVGGKTELAVSATNGPGLKGELLL